MPPHRIYNEAMRQTMLELCNIDTCRNVADDLGVHHATIGRYRRRRLGFGMSDLPTDWTAKGRPRKITKAIEDRIQQFITESSQSPYLDEIQDMLLTEFDVEVHLSSISRALKRAGWTRKRGRRLHHDRDEDVRFAFQHRMRETYTPEQLVFVDESGSNQRGLDRRYGWSPRGTAYRMTQTTKGRGGSYSILPAMDVTGYIDFTVVLGSIDKERYTNFIRQLVQTKMNAYPQPRSVIVMDNCSTHFSDEITQLAAEHHIIIEPLPPYSPDFNAIEESFSIIKAWIKRNRGFFGSFDSYGEFLYFAITQCGLSEHARALVTHTDIVKLV